MLFRTLTPFESFLLLMLAIVISIVATLLIFIGPGDNYKWAGISTVTALIVCLYIALFTMFSGRPTDIDSSRDRRVTETGESRFPDIRNLFGDATIRLVGLFVLYFVLCGFFTLEYIALAQLRDARDPSGMPGSA